MPGLAVIETPLVSQEQLRLIKDTVAREATDLELQLFLYDCQRQGVHPLDRLLHFTKRGGKYTPVTSIDLMRTRAADTNEYAGSDDAVFAGKPMLSDFACTVTVWRIVQSQRCAFTATARWSEYYPGDGPGGTMWRKMPHTMLAKCAEGLALRKGFPRQLAGLYASEEMDQAGSPAPVQRTSPPVDAPGRYPSKPNGGDSDSRPSGAEPLAGATLPADSMLDTRTGEILDAPPPGYCYIDNYRLSNGWHEFDLLGAAGDGGAMRLSTKKQIGYTVEQAFAAGLPIKVTTAPKKNARPGEAYLDTVTVWKPTPEPTHAPLVDDLDESSIPF